MILVTSFDIFSRNDMRNFLLRLIASFLDGNIRDQKFPIFTGSGANGKSTVMKLISKLLGDYYGTLPTTFLTRKKGSSSNATPELANLKGKRCVVMQESEFDEKIQVGAMKEITGGDPIYFRALYGDADVLHPQFKLLLVCNKKPNVEADDNGTWRRIMVVPFLSEFVENPVEPHQFLLDKNCEGVVATWFQGFMWLLLKKYYVQYIEKGLGIPASIIKETEEYRAKSDMLLQFFKDNYEKSDNDDDTIELSKLYNHYKEWFKNNQSGSNPIIKLEFKEYILKMKYKITKKEIVQNIRFIED